MSIERLNEAASAAGFAMATPDDDVEKVEAPAEEEVHSKARALVPSAGVGHSWSGDTLTMLSTWARGVWPTWGWRQPA